MSFTTTNLAEFGNREIYMAEELLKAFREDGLPSDFDRDGMKLMFNINSGCVFLTNDNYQAAMIRNGKLESFYSCPDCGEEGFSFDLMTYGNNCCIEFIKEMEE